MRAERYRQGCQFIAGAITTENHTMPTAIRTIGLIAAAGLGVFGPLTTPSTSLTAQPMTTERPFQPEKNPPGDIPDNQVFVPYTSPRGLSLKVPDRTVRKDLSDG